MCGQAQNRESLGGAPINDSGAGHINDGEARYKANEYHRMMALRTEMLQNHKAQFYISRQAGNMKMVNGPMSLAEAVDLMACPHEGFLTLEIVVPR
jgi:hypothetical protein